MAFFPPGAINALHDASKKYVAPTPKTGRTQKEPAIPDPGIFASLATDIPAKNDIREVNLSIAQCAVHLELLETFKRLRETVIKSNRLDVLFDTLPEKNYHTVYRFHRNRYRNERQLLKPIKLYDATFQDRRKTKWIRFCEYALGRFTTWAASNAPDSFNAARGSANELATLFIPPLDILLVWHALLLTPELSLDFGKRRGIIWIQGMDFPWKHIHTMIDTTDRTFRLPVENAEIFTEITGMQPDLLESLIECPKDALTADEGSIFGLAPREVSIQGFFADFDTVRQKHDGWVDRMCHYVWIRSPALDFTLRNAQHRYRELFDLLASGLITQLAPTPDVELAWLTHRLSPSSYVNFSKASVGRIVKHNVTDGERSDKSDLATIERVFQSRSGLGYQQCLCWDCQYLQSLAQESFSKDKDPELLIEQAVQEVAYHRAIERARRQKRD